MTMTKKSGSLLLSLTFLISCGLLKDSPLGVVMLGIVLGLSARLCLGRFCFYMIPLLSLTVLSSNMFCMLIGCAIVFRRLNIRLAQVMLLIFCTGGMFYFWTLRMDAARTMVYGVASFMLIITTSIIAEG